MSYFNSLIFDTNNYGIVTETLLSYLPRSEDNFAKTSFVDENSKWLVTQIPFQGQDTVPEKIIKRVQKNRNMKKANKRRGKKIKKLHKSKGKIKKCFLKLFKKKGKRRKKGLHKYMLPLIIGLVFAKSLFIPIILKLLTFVSAKGLLMGFFSTVLASILSLKSMFGSHGFQHRIDDGNTIVEFIQLPKEHYDEDPYSRRDLVPLIKRVNYN